MRRSIQDLPRRSAVALATASVLCGPATAGGFYVQDHSVKGAGRAYSGEAADLGADSLWWNPAAIARSGNEIYLGVHGRNNSTSVVDDGSDITRPIPPLGLTTPVGGVSRIDDPSGDRLIPNGAAVLRVNDRVALGLSVTQPFVLENTYGSQAWTRYDTIQSRVESTDFQATVAFQLASWLDAGIGVSAQYTDAELVLALPNLSPLLPDGRSALGVDGWNYGFVVGGQAHFSRITLGASYRSAVRHELKGRLAASDLLAPLDGANFQSAAEAVFSTPSIGIIGVRWRVTPEMTLNAQVQRFGWSEYDAVRVEHAGGVETIAQDFKDTTSGALGVDYDINPRLTVRGGVQYDPTPTRDHLREPGVVDGDRWVYAAGASLRLRPKLTIDAALSRTQFEDTRIAEDAVFYNGTPARTTARLRGKFEGNATTASIGLRLKF